MPRKGQYKTHCNNGHEFTKENTYVQPNSGRKCIECRKISKAKWLKANPDHNQRNYQNRKEKVLSYSRRRDLVRLGWSEKTYEQALKDQGGKCAICKSVCRSGRRLAADHIHVEPPIPRGLLCFACNTMLGKADDSIERLIIAVEYLKKYKT